MLGDDPAGMSAAELQSRQPEVAYAHFKMLWAEGRRPDALRAIEGFVNDDGATRDKRLAAKAWRRAASWRRKIHEPSSPEQIDLVVDSLRHATELDPGAYKAWHAWATVNFEAASRFAATGGERYVVPAIFGFFRSIALGREKSLQDLLRLLTLWFKHGADSEVAARNHAVITCPISSQSRGNHPSLASSRRTRHPRAGGRGRAARRRRGRD